jgi:hypothetical protein
VINTFKNRVKKRENVDGYGWVCEYVNETKNIRLLRCI